MKKSVVRTAMLAAIGLAMAAGPASAQFEVEEPEVEKGEVELRYDGDYHYGIPRRRVVAVDDGEELLGDDNEQVRQRHTIQLGMGLTDWLKIEVGGEFEEERKEEIKDIGDANGYLSLRGTEVEGQLVAEIIPLDGRPGFGLSLLAEASSAVESAEGNTIAIGPIIKAQQGALSATANLMFVKAFGGENEEEPDEDGIPVVEERFDDRWDFEYAWQIAYQVNSKLALAVEGFGTVERLGSSGWAAQATDEVIEELAEVGVDHRQLFRDHDQHRIGPVLYYRLAGEAEGAGGDDGDEGEDEDEAPSLTMGLGVLFGLNEDTPDAALKWSLEAEF